MGHTHMKHAGIAWTPMLMLGLSALSQGRLTANWLCLRWKHYD